MTDDGRAGALLRAGLYTRPFLVMGGWVLGVTHLRFWMGVGTWGFTHLPAPRFGFRVWVLGFSQHWTEGYFSRDTYGSTKSQLPDAVVVVVVALATRCAIHVALACIAQTPSSLYVRTGT